ncbi:hypothetical protein DFJ67_8138 [Asanoa ferruginea]|uniref:HEAT repeat protein n=1 Tax=Asanoa ferruginea TaxID=53367 RepID=A0A3D9ZXX7_9ACTN|nr:hypothetical protein [Asanoa ferruginea]REG02047.1 hypothetical protein DFJ67_8138 [Asanoa ferruginea]GIF52342.1 hypothetical protein Afe04nite_68810 [Asanoa ferruginea]
MSLRDADDAVRLAAIRRAATSGEVGLFDDLLDLALHDTSEVRTEGGLAEVYEHVGDAAAEALGRILRRRSGVDPRVRAVAFDLAHDDDRVATLLYYLGTPYEPLRRELLEQPEGRLRLRAVRAVLSTERRPELSARLLADPSAAIRVEGLRGPRPDRDTCLRLLRDDPSPEVRLVAARELRFAPQVGSEPFAAAALVERDPAARAMLLSCLARRRHDRANVAAIVGFLAEPAAYLRRDAAQALSDVDDPVAAAAIGLRLLVEPDRSARSALLAHQRLLTHVPELRDVLTRWARTPVNDGEHWSLGRALATPEAAAPAPVTDPAGLLRPVLRWAVAMLEPVVAASYDYGEADARELIRIWLAGGDDDLLRRVSLAEENLWHTDPHAAKLTPVWDIAGAARATDLAWARRIGLAAAAEQGRLDATARGQDPARGPLVAAARATALAELAHRLLAVLLAAGVDPPAPGPLVDLVRAGEDLVEAFRETLGPDDSPARLSLGMRPDEDAAYRRVLAAAAGLGADDPDLGATAVRRLVEHAGDAVRAWLAALVVDGRAPLRFSGVAGRTAPAPLGPAARAYAVDRAAVWLRDGRPTGPIRPGAADDLLRRRRDDTDLERLFRLIAEERVAHWHREVARAALAGEPPARTEPFGPDLLDPARPLDEPGDLVRLSNGALVPLTPGRPVLMTSRAWPERAGRSVRCAHCGGDLTVQGPVPSTHVDDDGYGRVERWFAATLTGDCPACGNGSSATVRLTLTDEPALSWE